MTARYVLPASLSMQYGALDAEHQNIVDILNATALLLESEGDIGPASTQLLLTDFREALKAHFSHEEQEMARLGYPELTKHKLGHALCIIRLDAMFQAVTGDQSRISMTLLDEIFGVLVSDILGPDLGFKSFLYDQNLLR